MKDVKNFDYFESAIHVEERDRERESVTFSSIESTAKCMQ